MKYNEEEMTYICREVEIKNFDDIVVSRDKL
jgi:hypothetical protein